MYIWGQIWHIIMSQLLTNIYFYSQLSTYLTFFTSIIEINKEKYEILLFIKGWFLHYFYLSLCQIKSLLITNQVFAYCKLYIRKYNLPKMHKIAKATLGAILRRVLGNMWLGQLVFVYNFQLFSFEDVLLKCVMPSTITRFKADMYSHA